MAELKDNTVPAENQMNSQGDVFLETGEPAGLRVLFAGNSITLHGYLPEIGWYGENYGMAASARENDYVHRLMAKLRTKTPAQMCICQVAEWERAENRDAKLPAYQAARDFAADVLIVRLIENCPADPFDAQAFLREYRTLIDWLNPTQTAKIILTTSFWQHPGDAVIWALAKERGYPCVELGDLGRNDAMMAKTRFTHTGVGMHPGDLGMKTIAERIWTELEKML